jgi:hypothetical protein
MMRPLVDLREKVVGIGGLGRELGRFFVEANRLFGFSRLREEEAHQEVDVGLLRLSRDESFDPLFDLGNVFWFLQTLRVTIPRFGELSAKQVDYVQGEMGSRMPVCPGGRMPSPGQCGLLRLIPLAFQQHRFTLCLVIRHRVGRMGYLVRVSSMSGEVA